MKNQRAARRKRRLGMTLIEIMIVVVIMALVATGVGMAVLPSLTTAKIKATTNGVLAVRSAAIAHLMTGNSECPTVPKLLEEKLLDKKNSSTDAWDHAFAIECDGDEVTVRSAGPDGILGTDDDIPKSG